MALTEPPLMLMSWNSYTEDRAKKEIIKSWSTNKNYYTRKTINVIKLPSYVGRYQLGFSGANNGRLTCVQDESGKHYPSLVKQYESHFNSFSSWYAIRQRDSNPRIKSVGNYYNLTSQERLDELYMNWVLLDAVFVPATKTFAVVDIVNAGSNMQLSDRGHLIDHSDFNKPQTFELGKLANADSNFLTTFVLSSLSPGETAKFLIRPNYATYKPGRQINRAYTITVTYKTATMKIVGISDKAITLAVPPKEYSLAVTGNTTGLAKIIQLLPKSFEGKYVRVVGNTSVKAEVFTNPDEVTLVDLVEGITDKECAL